MPRLTREVAVLIEKACDSALLAVETYNRPRTSFRSGGYIVLMCIAWTALFHAIFLKRKVSPFYRKKSNRRHFEVLDGDKKAWELSTCLSEFWDTQNPPTRANLQFFIKLRNKIEHRSMPGLDIEIFGECQALLFNFEDLLTHEFGNKYALNESLSLALQFSAHRNEQQEASIRKLHRGLAKSITSYIEAFRSSLGEDLRQDMRYSYKVFLLPKPANHASSADVSFEFIKYDPNNPEDMARINHAVALIKPTGAPAPVTLDGQVAQGPNGVAVRIANDDPTAIRIAAIDYDDTHPYRQKELLRRIKELLPEGTHVSTHDLYVVREEFCITENPNFYHKPRHSSAQYSDAYAQWIAEQFNRIPEFFNSTREKFRNRT